MSKPFERILILDFGSQYTQLIARRVRELGVYSEVYNYDTRSEKIMQFKPRGIILSGGPQSVTLTKSARIAKPVFDLQVPVLGICYGMQSMAVQLGGTASTTKARKAVQELAPSVLSLRVVLTYTSIPLC